MMARQPQQNQSERARAYFDSDLCQDDEIEIALHWCDNQKTSQSEEIFVVALSHHNFTFSKVLTPQGSINLVDINEFTSNASTTSKRGPVVALWPSKAMLSDIESNPQTTSIVVVTWWLTFVRDWAKSSKAINLYNSEWWSLDRKLSEAQKLRLEWLNRRSRRGR